MRKYSVVRLTDWAVFMAQIDPNILAYQMERSTRFPLWGFVQMSEATWELAKTSGKFLALPTPWAPASRLPANVQTVLGAIAPDALTVGQAIEDLVGKDIFRA